MGDDAGLYTSVAKNAYGEATTTRSVKVDTRHWLQAPQDAKEDGKVKEFEEAEQIAEEIQVGSCMLKVNNCEITKNYSIHLIIYL